MERIGAMAAESRARQMGAGTLALALVWSGVWFVMAEREGIWWALPAAAPWLLHCLRLVIANGPGSRDDFVQAHLPRLLALKKRRRAALLSGNAEEVDSLARREDMLRAELAEYFRRGRA